MELYLQFGHGMMGHCQDLISRWGGGTVILSPRDLDPGRIVQFAETITSIGNAEVLLDPQFYLPRANHHRLCSYDYWPRDYQTGTFWDGIGLDSLLSNLFELNVELGCRAFVLPGLLAREITSDWLNAHQMTIERARRMNNGTPCYATVALASSVLTNIDQVAALLESTHNWNVDGYYLVCEHPAGQYFVNDPNWLANLVDIIAGFRLQNKEVIVGYCNQQMLICAVAGSNAIASGTWMNVRSFPPGKFQMEEDEEVRRKAVWYYCPQMLSEFRRVFLDLCISRGILEMMRPAGVQDDSFTGMLFSSTPPSTAGFDFGTAFRHYLNCLHSQAFDASRSSFDDAVANQRVFLETAETLIQQAHQMGIRGEGRDFSAYIETNISALDVLSSTRGAILRRAWGQLNG